MIRANYDEDGRLDIVVLGPMGSDKQPNNTTLLIGDAIKDLLAEPAIHQFLGNIKEQYIHIPEEWEDAEIIKGILKRVDIADLVVVNLTPKDGPKAAPSPNVFYELGLLHALGIPVISIAEEGTDIPFYALTNRAVMVSQFSKEEIKSKLRHTLSTFLNPEDYTDFTDNRITQFYGGLPIIDISAAVGLATGYYYNFVGRLLTNGGIISHNKEKVKRLIIVRPLDVMNSYEEDKDVLEKALADNGYKLVEERGLIIPPGDNKGGIWVYHVDGVIIDLPRTIYPLKISPRLLSLQERMDKQGSFMRQHPARNIALKQLSEKLLDSVQNAILYHSRKDGERFRHKLLEFVTIKELPALLKQHGVQSNI